MNKEQRIMEIGEKILSIRTVLSTGGTEMILPTNIIDDLIFLFEEREKLAKIALLTDSYLTDDIFKPTFGELGAALANWKESK